MSFTASDDESGVAKIEFLLGTAVVAVEDLDADPGTCPHVDWGACPQRHGGDFSVDTSALAEGDYVGTLRVTDAAGNRRVIKHPDLIRVSKTGSQAVDAPNVDPEDAPKLTAQFAANARTTYTTSFGRAARIRGRLTDAKARSIANATVAITERFDSGGRHTATVTTGADGRYSYRASGRSPSRRIEVSSSAPAGGTPRKLRLLVRAASTLEVTLRGVLVTYKGRVTAQPLPRPARGSTSRGERRAASGSASRHAERMRRGGSRGVIDCVFVGLA